MTREALDRLRGEGVEIAVLDCISDDDLAGVCAAIAHLRLISGSSAPAMKLPAVWQREGWWKPAEVTLRQPEAAGRGHLVVAGSCSEATRRQNRWMEAQGARTFVIDPVALAEGDGLESAVAEAAAELAGGHTCLVRTASDMAPVREWAQARGRGVNETGLAIAYGLARAVRDIMERQLPAALVVAGGETAGAVCRTLELGALEVGRNIQPGVPLCVSLGRFRLPVVLKSGNFGSEDFYGRAIERAAALR